MGANIVKLKDVVDILNGYAFKSSKYVKSGHRVMRITNVQKGILVDDDPKYYEQSNDLNKYELKIGDILISLTGNVGRVGMVEEQILPAYLNQRVGCIRIKSDKVFDRYLFHLLNNDSFEDNCIRNSNGIAQLNMSTEWLKDVDINLPSLDEQKKIAKILDKADEIRTKKRLANDKLDEFLKSTFISMFGNISNKTTLFKYISSLSAGKSLAGDEECENKVLNTSSVTWDKFDKKQYKNYPLDYIPQEEHKVKNGDVIISRMNTPALVGTAGYVWDVDENIYLPDRLWKANITDNVNSIFLWQLLIQPSTKIEIQKIATGTSGSMKNISKEKFLKLSVIDVEIEEQNKFAKIVEKVETQKQKNEQVIEQMDNLFNSLSQLAFKGELTKSNVVDLLTRQVALHSKIIDKCHSHQTFGAVKLEKIFNLCDMIQDLNLVPGGYYRKAAGPYVPEMRHTVEQELLQNDWVKITNQGNGKKVEYKKDANFVAYKAVYNQIFNDKNQEIEKIIDYFYDKDTNYCEAFSTLYMCWNDLILEGKSPTKTEIIDEFKNHWAPEKQRFERIYLLEILSDMSNQGFEPQGHCVHTIESNYNHNKDQLSLQLK